MARIDALLATVNRGIDTQAVRQFIDDGLDVNTCHPEAGTALMAAALQGHRAMLDTLLALGADPEQAHRLNQMRALHVSAANGHHALIIALLHSGATVDALDNQQWTPLMFAAQEGHTEAVDALLDAGAEVDRSDERGCSALMQAARGGHGETVRTLLGHGADANFVADWATPLIMAASAGREESAQQLLDAGADVDFLHREEGYSALMLAALQGHSDVVQLLLARDADTNLQTAWGVSALTMAQRGGQGACAALLVDAGAAPVGEVPQPVETPSGWVGDPMLIAAAQR